MFYLFWSLLVIFHRFNILRHQTRSHRISLFPVHLQHVIAVGIAIAAHTQTQLIRLCVDLSQKKTKKMQMHRRNYWSFGVLKKPVIQAPGSPPVSFRWWWDWLTWKLMNLHFEPQNRVICSETDEPSPSESSLADKPLAKDPVSWAGSVEAEKDQPFWKTWLMTVSIHSPSGSR